MAEYGLAQLKRMLTGHAPPRGAHPDCSCKQQPGHCAAPYTHFCVCTVAYADCLHRVHDCSCGLPPFGCRAPEDAHLCSCQSDPERCRVSNRDHRCICTQVATPTCRLPLYLHRCPCSPVDTVEALTHKHPVRRLRNRGRSGCWTVHHRVRASAQVLYQEAGCPWDIACLVAQ
jgi:hypothetical protein